MDIQQLESKLAKRPKTPLFARLASLYLEQSQLDEAKALCVSGIVEHPSYTTAYVVLAKCYTVEQQYGSALDILRNVIEFYPDSAALQEFHKQLMDRVDAGTNKLTEIPAEEAVASVIMVPEGVVAHEDPLIDVEDQPAEPKESEEVAEEIVEGGDVVDEVWEETEVFALPLEPPAVAENSPEEVQAVTTSEPPSVEAEPEIVPSPPQSEKEIVVEPPQSELASRSEHTLVEESDTVHVQETESAETVESTPASLPIEAQRNVAKSQEPEATTEENRIVSRTLAEIYAMQGEYNEAIMTYELLKRQKPELTEESDRRIKELEEKLKSKPMN